MPECPRPRAAASRVYVHLIVYLLVNSGLLVLNLLSGRPFWFIWPALGWGIGLLAHGVSVGGWRFLGTDWEERKIREELDRRKREGGR
ncbi:MAG TPA: 2TM domain-containing protein [Anaeromyxobacteraceae bacterium]|nr:2TM domain-containing protein [Anaeromyxobacteraceae bacterium]